MFEGVEIGEHYLTLGPPPFWESGDGICVRVVHSLQIDRNAPDAAWQLETARMSAATAAPAPAPANPAQNPANDKNKVNIKKEVKKKPKASLLLNIFHIWFMETNWTKQFP